MRKKKIISALVCLCLMIPLMPAEYALAEEEIPMAETPEAYAQSEGGVYGCRMTYGERHGAVVLADKTVRTWGDDKFGQCKVPAGLEGVTAVAAGDFHTLALKEDGTLTGWGSERKAGSDEYSDEDLIPYLIPEEVSRERFKAVAAGDDLSAGVTLEGKVLVWGTRDENGVREKTPANLTGAEAVAVNNIGVVALGRDGKITAWGSEACENIESGYKEEIVSVKAGRGIFMALKKDGTIGIWSDREGVQERLRADRDKIRKEGKQVCGIGAGHQFGIALLRDGTVRGLRTGFTMVTPYDGNSGIRAICATAADEGSILGTMAMKKDGLVAPGWRGDKTHPYLSVFPAGLSLKAGGTSPSEEARLRSLTVMGNPVEGFSPDRFEYEAVVSGAAAEVEIAAEPVSGGIREMSCNGQEMAPGVPATVAAPPEGGQREAVIRVLAEDGKTEASYRIRLIRNTAPSTSEAALKRFSLYAGIGGIKSISPQIKNFDPEILYYTVELSKAAKDLSIVPTLKPKTSLKINGQPANSGRIFLITDVPSGLSTVILEVTAESGVRRTYTLKLNKEEGVPETDNTLRELKVEGYDFDFDPAVTRYAFNVPLANEVTSVAVTAVPAASRIRKLKIDKQEVPSGVAVRSHHFFVGENTVKVDVMPEDQQSGMRTYELVFTVEEAKGSENLGIPRSASAYRRNPAFACRKRITGTPGSSYLLVNEDGTLSQYKDPLYSSYDPVTLTPPALTDVKEIVSNQYFVAALKRDGTVVVWGHMDRMKKPFPADLKDVETLEASYGDIIALKKDGAVAACGANSSGVSDVPPGLTDVVSVACGFDHCLALKKDGTVAAWGNNSLGQCDVPPDLKDVDCLSGFGYNNEDMQFRSMVIKKGGIPVIWGGIS